MTEKEIEALAQVTGDAIKRCIAPLKAELAAAKEEIAALKAELAKSVKFRGTFQGGKSYTAGDMVRHQGSLWICQVATQGTPSKDFVGWELALKKGDAR